MNEIGDKVPEHTLESLRNYVEHRLPPGGFLGAVLENNLSEACGRADTRNLYALWDIVKYVYNCVPSECWGSPEKVAAWLRGNGR